MGWYIGEQKRHCAERKVVVLPWEAHTKNNGLADGLHVHLKIDVISINGWMSSGKVSIWCRWNIDDHDGFMRKSWTRFSNLKKCNIFSVPFYFILLQYHEAIGTLHLFNSAERYCQTCWREELLNNHLHYKSVQKLIMWSWSKRWAKTIWSMPQDRNHSR
jgi:hypothetical protein